jgi:hypothetical protein
LTITREEALETLKNYLAGTQSKVSVHQWALNIVISSEYEKLHASDELLAETIHALFDLHHEGAETSFDPSREELEYYKKCLEGEIKYSHRR